MQEADEEEERLQRVKKNVAVCLIHLRKTFSVVFNSSFSYLIFNCLPSPLSKSLFSLLVLLQIDSTLTKISEGYTRGDRSCYNERFLQAVASYSRQASASFESVAHILRKMLRMVSMYVCVQTCYCSQRMSPSKALCFTITFYYAIP